MWDTWDSRGVICGTDQNRRAKAQPTRTVIHESSSLLELSAIRKLEDRDCPFTTLHHDGAISEAQCGQDPFVGVLFGPLGCGSFGSQVPEPNLARTIPREQ
jgi:hypothetical protein